MRVSSKNRLRRALAAVICCLGLAGAALLLCRAGSLRPEERPPGVHIAKRTLLTVWLLGDDMGAGAWLAHILPRFAQENPGAKVWIRRASRNDIAALVDSPDGAPDVLLFALGEAVAPSLLRSLAFSPPLDAKRLSAGRLNGDLLAVPVCAAGYALLVRTQEPAPTRAPVSLFGLPPEPSAPLSPSAAPPQDAALPGRVAVGDGFGAYALSLLDTGVDADILPESEALAAFERGDAAAALLSTRQLAACDAGYRALAASPASDLAVFAAVTKRGGALADAFVAFLLSEASQRALQKQYLLAARRDCFLYGGDLPALALCERALAGGDMPNAFTWPDRRADTLCAAQALCLAGVSAWALGLD